MFRQKPAVRKPTNSQRPNLNYYRARSKTDLGSSPFEKKLPKKAFKFGALFSRSLDAAIVIIIAFCLLYSLIVRSHATVVTSSTIYHSTGVYQTAADQQLKSFKNHNKITFDEAAIVKNLRAQFPEISQATIELPLFGQKPKISLTIAKPAFWFSSQGSKFVIDSQGIATALSANSPHISQLPTVQDQSGFKAAAGQQVLSSQDVNFIESVIAQSQNAKVPLKALILPVKAQELDLQTADRSYLVKFFLGGDPLLQTGQFLAARHQFDQSGTQPTDYLDVRVAGKIYVK